LVGRPEGKKQLDGLGVDVGIILKGILIRKGGTVWTELIRVRTKKMWACKHSRYWASEFHQNSGICW